MYKIFTQSNAHLKRPLALRTEWYNYRHSYASAQRSLLSGWKSVRHKHHAYQIIPDHILHSFRSYTPAKVLRPVCTLSNIHSRRAASSMSLDSARIIQVMGSKSAVIWISPSL